MQIHGISNLRVNSFVGNFTDNGFIVKMGVECKQIKADGQFKADVKFGGLRLVPKGPFNITLGKQRLNIASIKYGKFFAISFKKLNYLRY